MNKSSLKKLGRGLEFASVATGLVIGAVFLDPMDLKSKNTNTFKVSKVAASSMMPAQKKSVEIEMMQSVIRQPLLKAVKKTHSI